MMGVLLFDIYSVHLRAEAFPRGTGAYRKLTEKHMLHVLFVYFIQRYHSIPYMGVECVATSYTWHNNQNYRQPALGDARHFLFLMTRDGFVFQSLTLFSAFLD